jgi:hypothetical protein
VNNYNVSLLDRAEIKIRNLGTPKATRTLLQRTCNFRSVKLSNPGSPICDILKYDIYALLNDGDRVNIAKEYVDIIKTKYPNSTLRINDEKTFDEALNQSIDGVVLDINALQPGLECYTKLKVVGGSSIESIFNKKLMPEKSKALLALTSCYKEFMFQTYPEIN